MSSTINETATIIQPPSDEPGWPIIGPETEALRATPDVHGLGVAFDRIIEEARKVLRRAMRPAVVGQAAAEVGLATGYVQSGKTLNFTTVCALARDNGIPLVVVITGISTPLFGQSNARLQRDLRLLSRTDRKWLHIPINTKDPSPTQRINDTLFDWSDVGVPEGQRQTLLVTVMKNYRHLAYLARHLSSVALENVPCLVIDDEGDQASLNYLASRNRESTNYREIGRLRQLFRRHGYVQYTATPQAPLLINIIDALSPSFAEVLEPGDGYTGGQAFFSPGGTSQYVRTIPAAEIFAPGQALAGPPPTFRAALAAFFIGVVVGELVDNAHGCRSMLIHPHQQTGPHDDYFVWAENLRAEWQRAITAPLGDESRIQVLELLRRAYDDLLTTSGDLPPFERIVDHLPRSIRRTSILEVNADRGKTPSIPWRDRYAHVLVGGQALDRGFTVEGLTVTYMPRGLGQGNADTVQQRARFFGYKTGYLALCRVWLEQGVREAFEDYLEHEESMRSQLRAHSASGKPLNDWKRAFFLDGSLQATRRQVVRVAYSRGNHAERWVDPSRPHELQDAVEQNNALIDSYLGRLSFEDDVGHPQRTAYQRHRVANGVPLAEAHEELLAKLRLPAPSDSLNHTALLLQVKRWSDSTPGATCSVYVMSPAAADRVRTRQPDDDLGNFYQGANPSDGPSQGSIYPGDCAIRHPSDLTIQIHTYDLRPHRDGEDQTAFEGVKIAAIYVPRDMGRDWLVQDGA